MAMTDLSGQVVLITGASRGIGAAAARSFAANGAKVALVARSASEITEIASEIGVTAMAIPCDVAEYSEVEAAIASTVSAYGSLDVIVNNAGVIEPIAHLADADPAAWGKVIDINLKGAFHGMRAALPVMLGQTSGGTILNISSGAAKSPVEAWSHYCASKAGALMLTRMGHKEYGEAGIRVLGLSPGTVATKMQREIAASGINPISKLAWEDHIPAEWAAEALVWMCGPGADPWLGEDVSLRDEETRKLIGLDQ